MQQAHCGSFSMPSGWLGWTEGDRGGL